jgi:hypothetical protein
VTFSAVCCRRQALLVICEHDAVAAVVVAAHVAVGNLRIVQMKYEQHTNPCNYIFCCVANLLVVNVSDLLQRHEVVQHSLHLRRMLQKYRERRVCARCYKNKRGDSPAPPSASCAPRPGCSRARGCLRTCAGCYKNTAREAQPAHVALQVQQHAPVTVPARSVTTDAERGGRARA